MADTCPHGLPSAECLICRTLAPAGRAPSPARSGPGAAPAGRGRDGSRHLAGVALGIVVIGLVAWVVAGAVFALLHVLELVLVAGAAGWAGYRVGLLRGGRRRD